jgi:hypothetical protein
LVEYFAYNEKVSGSSPLLPIFKEDSSVGRIIVSKTIGRGFESLSSCLNLRISDRVVYGASLEN